MDREVDVLHTVSARRQTRAVGQAIARLAARQHGVISRAQLLEVGLTRSKVAFLIESGRLHRIHRGVYSVGHTLTTRLGRWLAAVLAAGPGSALSHQSAGANLEVISGSSSLIHVTTPTTRRQRAGMRLHFARLPSDEIEDHNGIPTTTLARTMLDLAAAGDRFLVERAMAQAEFDHLTDPLGIPAIIDRYPSRRGTRILREVYESRLPSLGVAKSWLEARFLRFLDSHNLARPELNAPLEMAAGTWIKADCLWRSQRLVVELDGRAAHLRAANFESDRARDRRLTVLGFRPMRITRKQLEEEGPQLAVDLGTLLSAA